MDTDSNFVLDNGVRNVPLTIFILCLGLGPPFIFWPLLYYFKFNHIPPTAASLIALATTAIAPMLVHTFFPNGGNIEVAGAFITSFKQNAWNQKIHGTGHLYWIIQLPYIAYNFFISDHVFLLVATLIVNIGQILTENLLEFKALRVIYKDAPGPRITRPLRCVIISYGLIWHFFRRTKSDKSKDQQSKFNMTSLSILFLPLLIFDTAIPLDFIFCDRNSIFLDENVANIDIAPVLRGGSTEFWMRRAFIPAYVAMYWPEHNILNLCTYSVECFFVLFSLCFDWKTTTDAYGDDCLYQYRDWLLLLTTAVGWLIYIRQPTRLKTE